MITKFDLEIYLKDLLNLQMISDPYCSNGLQIEGKEEIKKIVTGVSANLAFIKAAIAEKADCIIVHHGLFWYGDDARIVGIQYNRISHIIKHDLNLFAYHLPLDVHNIFGNNIQLAKLLDLEFCHLLDTNSNPQYGILCQSQEMSLDTFVKNLSDKLKRIPIVIGQQSSTKKFKVAICTGAGQKFIYHAIKAGADIYISGEISEKTTHLALESGIIYIAAGHHATERYGVQAIGEHLAEQYKLQHQFIEIENIV